MIPKPRPRVLEKAEKRQKQQAAYRATCAAVDKRDRYRCRGCGKPCDPKAVDSLKRGHHHHIEFRSRGGGDETSNVILVCAFCHAAIHDRRVTVSGDGNDAAVFTWHLS